MGKIIDKTAEGIYVGAAIGFWPIFIVLIAIIGMVKCCVTTPVDPMDNSNMKQSHIIRNLIVYDSARNGFEVVYQTTNAVTNARFDEIWSRKHIDIGFEKLQKEAPEHFGLMLNTDIYDFGLFAVGYIPDPDITINTIFVYGRDKEDMYRQPNPNGDNFATLKEIYTEQGIQYIRGKDIFYYKGGGTRIYRYWQCNGIYSTSSTDERFSHVEKREIRMH